MTLRTKVIVGGAALALVAAAAAGWRLQEGAADQTYEAAAAAAGADRGEDAVALLRQACRRGSRRACETLGEGGGPDAILH
jgi:hypothetical protein